MCLSVFPAHSRLVGVGSSVQLRPKAEVYYTPPAAFPQLPLSFLRRLPVSFSAARLPPPPLPLSPGSLHFCPGRFRLRLLPRRSPLFAFSFSHWMASCKFAASVSAEVFFRHSSSFRESYRPARRTYSASSSPAAFVDPRCPSVVPPLPRALSRWSLHLASDGNAD